MGMYVSGERYLEGDWETDRQADCALQPTRQCAARRFMVHLKLPCLPALQAVSGDSKQLQECHGHPSVHLDEMSG